VVAAVQAVLVVMQQLLLLVVEELEWHQVFLAHQ